jgi:hypothetical protein
MSQFRIDEIPFWAGWAMDAYPEMSSDEIRGHVARQKAAGCNFTWGGHNNPGEVDQEKIEPAMSYAVYAALVNPADPLHGQAKAIFDAQIRLLEACRDEDMPIVFPIGYQIQMGKDWNENWSEHLRRDKEGQIVDWGGRSACFYSPQYQEDIQRYYEWISNEVIKPFSDTIVMVNLSDEPFGGDYSHWAEEEFKERSGMTFAEAERAGDDGLFALGKFQGEYIADYAGWSARAWSLINPDHPTTVSFCGHHGREDYAMPYIPAVFELTPENFYPTWDVYPRDGHFYNPVQESDISPLIVFLQQLSRLSARHDRPVFFWTTGNSWGLGQSSSDKANIADALVNQFYLTENMKKNGGSLGGIAIWNYNIKVQGLYNDTNPIIYDPDEMFEKLSAGLKNLRVFMDDCAGENKNPKTQEVVVTASRDYIFRHNARSGAAVRPFPFALGGLHRMVKSGARIRLCETLKESCDEAKALVEGGNEVVWVLLSDADDREFTNGANWKKLLDLAGRCSRVTLPALLIESGIEGGHITADETSNLHRAYKPVTDWGVEDYEAALCPIQAANLYTIRLGETTILYNLTKGNAFVAEHLLSGIKQEDQAIIISPETRILHEANGPVALNEFPPVPHHGLCLIGNKGAFWMKCLTELFSDSTVSQG